MKVGEHYYCILVYLQMARLCDTLGAHHFHEIAVPLCKLCPIVVAEPISRNNIILYTVEREIIGSYQVLDLPHIQQILCYIFLS